jgi:DNA-binding transcriptional LysR family regulator
MDFNRIIYFVEVVRNGSFTAAAQSLGLSKSHLSSSVADLEIELGVTLLTRTTRKLTLTEEGELFYLHSKTALAEIERGHEEIKGRYHEPLGTVKIAAPYDLGSGLLTSAICKYMDEFPKVKVDLIFSDRVQDLVAERFDLGVRVGILEDSTLIAKKVGTSGFSLFASPKYLKKSLPLKTPKDLLVHQCLLFSEFGTDIWELQGPKGKQKIKIIPHSKANHFGALKQMVLCGKGIALMPPAICAEELARGEVINPLPEWQTKCEPVHIVYPARRFLSPKIRELIPYLEKAIQQMSGF